MNFCMNCGAPVQQCIPPGDDRLRSVCDHCGTIHYENPKMVVGCIPEWKDKILLCRRAIEPRYGWWTIPAGYLENGETLMEGAKRETLEEAQARKRDVPGIGVDENGGKVEYSLFHPDLSIDRCVSFRSPACRAGNSSSARRRSHCAGLS